MGEVEFSSGLGLSHYKTNLNSTESGRDLSGDSVVGKNLLKHIWWQKPLNR